MTRYVLIEQVKQTLGVRELHDEHAELQLKTHTFEVVFRVYWALQAVHKLVLAGLYWAQFSTELTTHAPLIISST